MSHMNIMTEVEQRNGFIPQEAQVDVDAIQHKYNVERDKRLVRSGISQFREAVGELAKFDKDPHAKSNFERETISEDVDVLIVGCGFGGLLAAKTLRDKGITNIRMVDKAGDFGGVWYWNRYPGLGCDTEA